MTTVAAMPVMDRADKALGRRARAGAAPNSPDTDGESGA